LFKKGNESPAWNVDIAGKAGTAGSADIAGSGER
jgi:hypothetical protein